MSNTDTRLREHIRTILKDPKNMENPDGWSDWFDEDKMVSALEALINDAVREAEIKGRNYAWSQVLHYQDVPLELKEHIRGRIRASTLNNDKDSKDKEETDG